MKRVRRCITAACALAVLSASCMGPPRVISSPKTYLPLRRPSTIWIRENGDRVRINSPRLLGDTLYGRTGSGEEVWRSINDANLVIEARQMDKTKTALLIGGVAAAVVAVGMATGGNGDVEPPLQEDSWVARRHRSAFQVVLLRLEP